MCLWVGIRFIQGGCFWKWNIAGLKDRLLNSLLRESTNEKEGHVIDRTNIKEATAMLVSIGITSREIYENYFETHFFENTAQYFQIEAQNCLSQETCPEYLKKAERRIKEEKERCQNFLDKNTVRSASWNRYLSIYYESCPNTHFNAKLRTRLIDHLW